MTLKFEHQELNFYSEDSELSLIFRLVKTEKDLRETTDFYFYHFMTDEPCCKAHGGYAGGTEQTPGLIHRIEKILREGLTLIMVESDTGKIVGCNTTCKVDRATLGEPSTLDYYAKRLIFPQSHLSRACDIVCPPHDILKKFPGVESAFSMKSLAVHPEYRKRGLGTKMVKLSLELAKTAGFKLAWAVSTSDYTWKMFNSLGMSVWKSMKWTDFKDDEGRPFFKEVESRGIAGHYIQL